MSEALHSERPVEWRKPPTTFEWGLLDAVRAAGQTTKSSLKDTTGIPLASISAAVADLSQRGFIITEKPAAQGTKPGPVPEALSLNPDAGYFIGVQMSDNKMVARLIDFTFQPVEGPDISEGYDPKKPITILSSVDTSIKRAAAIARDRGSLTRLLGVGVARPYYGISSIEVHQPNDKSIYLDDDVKDQLQNGIAIDNGPRSAAQAELNADHEHSVLAKDANAVYVQLDEKFGLGLIIDGKVHGGAKGEAGGAEHSLTETKDGKICSCGLPHCTSYELSYGSALETWKNMSHDGTTLEEAVTLAAGGDETAKQFFADYASRLTKELVPVLRLIAPNKVVLGGKMSKFYGSMFPQVVGRLISENLGLVSVQQSKLPDDVQAIGAAINSYKALQTSTPSRR